MVNALLVTFAKNPNVTELELHTHVFFQDGQRISDRSLGTWRINQRSSLLSTNDFDWFSGKLSDFHGFKVGYSSHD